MCVCMYVFEPHLCTYDNRAHEAHEPSESAAHLRPSHDGLKTNEQYSLFT